MSKFYPLPISPHSYESDILHLQLEKLPFEKHFQNNKKRLGGD